MTPHEYNNLSLVPVPRSTRSKTHDHDQAVQEAYIRLKNNPNSTHRNGWVFNNCKSEARKLLEEAGL